jgi:hypothetical protein
MSRAGNRATMSLAGFRPTALRLILSDDLPLCSDQTAQTYSQFRVMMAKKTVDTAFCGIAFLYRYNEFRSISVTNLIPVIVEDPGGTGDTNRAESKCFLIVIDHKASRETIIVNWR